MKRAAWIAQLLRRYGSRAVCDGQQAYVLLYPLQNQTEQNCRYRLTAPAAFRPSVGAMLDCLGHSYTVLRCDGVFAEGCRLYTWAILQLQDEWGR